nr:alpha/beta hydrolase [Oceanococcus sp. HetDA_MAG_MS8]
MGQDEYSELGSEAWLSALKNSAYAQVLFFIHGFSNLPESSIFPRALALQQLCDAVAPETVQVIPVIWPCDDDPGIVKDYWDDQKSADMSGFSFARALEFFMRWRNAQPEDQPCTKRINVLAHSMGNRVLRQTLACWNRYDLANGVPLLFRNTFLMAADIVNESLEENQDGRLISQASRNVVVYFASDDLALRASKVSNLKNKVASRRLGHTGPESLAKTPSNVFAVDCDNFNTRYDPPKGHSYFIENEAGAPGVVFEHMLQAMQSGRVPMGDQAERLHIL